MSTVTITFHFNPGDGADGLCASTKLEFRIMDSAWRFAGSEELRRHAAEQAGRFWESVVMMGLTEQK